MALDAGNQRPAGAAAPLAIGAGAAAPAAVEAREAWPQPGGLKMAARAGRLSH